MNRLVFFRFIKNNLDEKERELILDKLEDDDAFRQEFDAHAAIAEGIKLQSEKELKDYILQNSRIRLIKNNWGRSWTTISAIIVGLAILFVILNNQASKEHEEKQRENLVKNVRKNFISRLNQTLKDYQEKISQVQVPAPEPVTPLPPAVIKEKISEAKISVAEDSVNSISFDEIEEQEIQVKKDELIETRLVEILDKDTVTTDATTSETVEKLNSFANLPEPEARNLNLMVELWSSPLNFKGYRLLKNRLIVYGLDHIDSLKIIRYNHALYLQLQKNKVYLLESAQDFQPLTKTHDPAIVKLFDE